MLNSIPIKTKIFILVGIIMLVFFVQQMIIAHQQYNEMINAKETELLHLVESAVSIAEEQKKLADDGNISVEEAKQIALNELRSIAYDKINYIFVYKYDGTRLAYRPVAETEGKNYLNLKDQNGVMVIKDLIDVAKKGGGFVKYNWDKGSKKNVPKTSYADAIDDWEWMIGTGMYMDDIDELAAAQKMKIYSTFAIILVLAILATLWISRNLRNILSSLVEEANNIEEKINEGRIDYRADAELINFEFRGIISGINNIMDAFMAPLNVSNEYIQSIAVGKMPAKITDDYKGDFLVMKNNTNRLINNLENFISEMKEMYEQHKIGEMDYKINSSQFEGFYVDMAEGVNKSVGLHTGNIVKILDILQSYADGDFRPQLEELPGKLKIINNNLETLRNNLNNISLELKQFVTSIFEGQLDYRGNSGKYKNDWKKIINGINGIIDAFYEPINMMAEYIDSIAHGIIPNDITNEYRGEFNGMKNNINQALGIIRSLHIEIKDIIKSISNGVLDKRGNSDHFENGWKEIIGGINNVIDAFMRPITLTDEYVDRIAQGDIPPEVEEEFRGEFNLTKNNLNQLITSLNMFIADMQKLYEEQSKGDIDYFIDSSKFIGAYKDMADGVNKSVNLHIKNQNDMLDILTSYANGDFDPEMRQLPGKQRIINEKLLQMKRNLISVIDEIAELTQAAKEGQLKKRGNADIFSGSWQKLILGMNELLTEIMTPIDEAMQVMGEISSKNLTARITGYYNGDMNDFKTNINNAAQQLQDAILQVDSAVDQISSASEEIAHGSQSLAQGTSEQASSLSEISHGLENMSAITMDNADKSKSGATLSKEAISNVQVGNEAMNRMKSAMEVINKSANETGKIIKTIDEIAFQTNLLALNAAVEAAHAGEAGKGFAVVAEEVKNLALRSAEAAKNTNALIEESLKNSEAGVNIVSDVTKAFEQINTSFQKVNTIVDEISVSSDEQARGIERINSSITEISTLTQRNASNAEESASAAEELNSQSAELEDMVKQFKID